MYSKESGKFWSILGPGSSLRLAWRRPIYRSACADIGIKMNILRFIVFVIVLYAGYRALKYLMRPKNERPAGEGEPARPDDFVRCAVCGLHIPKAQALSAREDYYCCVEHRDRSA